MMVLHPSLIHLAMHTPSSLTLLCKYPAQQVLQNLCPQRKWLASSGGGSSRQISHVKVPAGECRARLLGRGAVGDRGGCNDDDDDEKEEEETGLTGSPAARRIWSGESMYLSIRRSTFQRS
jgi:hypothetical protein